MTRLNTVALLLTMLFVAVCLAIPVTAAEIEPAPKTYVTDRAGVIDSAAEQRLTGLLQELEQKTTARIVVLTVNSTDGLDIHQFAFERADQWKFGRNRAGASALVVVAVKDRKYRIEVGYDWEGILPDGYVGQVGRDYFVPNFRAGNYGQGIFEVTAVLAQTIAKEKGVALTGMPKLTMPARRRPVLPCAGGLFPLLMLLMLFSGRRRSRGLLFWGLLAGSMMGGGRSSGGGFGGGGFGSFGGGGGGGFGGGGASGGW